MIKSTKNNEEIEKRKAVINILSAIYKEATLVSQEIFDCALELEKIFNIEIWEN